MYASPEDFVTTVQQGKSLNMLYENASERQESLLYETVNICLSLILEEKLRHGDGFYQLKQQGLLKPDVTAADYSAALQDAPHTGNRASDIAHALRYHDHCATADTLVAPEELTLFQEEVEHFRREVIEYEERLALTVAAYRDGWPIDFPAPPVQPVHPWSTALNKVGDGIVQLREMGAKQHLRAEEKLETRYSKTAADASPLADVVRLTLVPHTPEIADRLAWEITSTYPNHYDEGWELKASGYIDRKCLIDQGGFVAEVKIEDAVQQAAYVKSYQVYKVLRPFMDKAREFKGENLPLDKAESLHLDYNKIMQRFAAIDRRYGAHITPRPLEDFLTGVQTLERQQELQALHQSIHRIAAEDSAAPWKALYLTKAQALNETYQAQGKPAVFDETWLNAMRETLPQPLLAKFAEEQKNATQLSTART